LDRCSDIVKTLDKFFINYIPIGENSIAKCLNPTGIRLSY
jgi:hypothetical protein